MAATVPTIPLRQPFLPKWLLGFADNEFQNITEGTFRNFATDIDATFVTADKLTTNMVRGATFRVPYLTLVAGVPTVDINQVPARLRIQGMEIMAANGVTASEGAAGVKADPIFFRLIAYPTGPIDALVDEQATTTATVKARLVRTSGTEADKLAQFELLQLEDKSYLKGEVVKWVYANGVTRLIEWRANSVGQYNPVPTGRDDDPIYAPFAPLAPATDYGTIILHRSQFLTLLADEQLQEGRRYYIYDGAGTSRDIITEALGPRTYRQQAVLVLPEDANGPARYADVWADVALSFAEPLEHEVITLPALRARLADSPPLRGKLYQVTGTPNGTVLARFEDVSGWQPGGLAPGQLVAESAITASLGVNVTGTFDAQTGAFVPYVVNSTATPYTTRGLSVAAANAAFALKSSIYNTIDWVNEVELEDGETANGFGQSFVTYGPATAILYDPINAPLTTVGRVNAFCNRGDEPVFLTYGAQTTSKIGGGLYYELPAGCWVLLRMTKLGWDIRWQGGAAAAGPGGNLGDLPDRVGDLEQSQQAQDSQLNDLGTQQTAFADRIEQVEYQQEATGETLLIIDDRLANVEGQVTQTAANVETRFSDAKAYTDQQVISAPKVAGPYDASGNPGYPTSGTGPSGGVRRGDTYNISVAGTVAGIPVEYGDALQALVATPGQVATNWQILQANLFGATETVAGTSKVATAALVQNEASTEDTTYVTPKKLWGNFVPRLFQLARTVSGLWNFTTSPTVPVATLPEQAMRYGQRLLLGTTDTTAAYGNHAHTPDELVALALAGLPLIASTFIAKLWNLTQASALTSGNIRYIPVYLPVAATVTGAVVYLAASGVFTESNENSFSLYSLAGGIVTRVATTGNNPGLFKGSAQSYVQGAFTAPYTAVAGLYYVGILYSASAATTIPTLGAGPNLNNAGMAVLPSGKLLPSLFAQTSAPATATISSMSNSNNPVWAGVN